MILSRLLIADDCRMIKCLKNMNKTLIYILLTLFAWSTYAQDLPKISLQADTLQIRPGEQIKLQVQTKTDTLSFVDFPELSQLGPAEVVRTSLVDTLQAKPIRHLQKNYFITAWDTGHYVVPPLQIKINDTVLVTDSLRIQVKPVMVDTTKQDLYGFKPPVSIDGTPINDLDNTTNYWWWLLGLLLLAASGYYWYRRRQKLIAAQHVLTPYEIARKRLNQLAGDKLWLRQQVDAHYLQLTDTLKEYLENELGISAKEKISSELLQSLKKYRFENGQYFSAELLQRLEQTLKRADLAKFAKLSPNPADIDLDFNVVKDIIDYAHQIVQQIADEKAAALAEKEAAKKRKKRNALIITTVMVFLIGLIGGFGYYYLNKLKLVDNLKENMAAPEWVYNEYGSNPALALTTPHILHAIDMSEALEKMPSKQREIIDEISVYGDENLVKKYMILVVNIDFKQKIPEQVDMSQAMMAGLLKQIGAREVNLQQSDLENTKRYFGDFKVDVPVLGNNVKVQFDSRFYQLPTGEKFVIGMYLEGNKDNTALIERVLQSAELVKE